MASKKGIRISYQWRLFVPVLLCFWIIMISMAAWQIYRVRDVKRRMVFDQLELVGERIVDLFNGHGDIHISETFMNYINVYYSESRRYESMSMQVRDMDDGEVVVNIGHISTGDIKLPPETKGYGEFTFNADEVDDKTKSTKFMYYVNTTDDGDKKVYVFLPYTMEVAEVMSESTTRFWLMFFCIAVFVSIMAYISSMFFSRNVRILRDFVDRATGDEDFKTDGLEFPHDELGDISHKIITLYQRMVEEKERSDREHSVALHAVEDKNRMKRELTNNINHELKTPVGVIQGYIDTIVNNPDMDEETRMHFLLKTRDNVHRLTNLIKDITAITKLESGGKLVNVEEIDYHDLVFKFEDYLREGNLLGDMKFSYDIPLDCKVFGNDSLLTLVLLNFVKNSVAYSEGTICRLEFVKEDKEFCYFRYYDDGVGIPPEHFPHLFERFYRVNVGRSRETGGTGLGLAIVEVTITSFGGSIEVQNHIPHGLEFNFKLRRTRPHN